MPPIRKLKNRQGNAEVDHEHGGVVIPTPSFDQVLQNIASNALAGDEFVEDGLLPGDNSKSDDDMQNGSKITQAHEEISGVRRSKRKQNLVIQPAKLRIISQSLTTEIPREESSTNQQNLTKNQQNGVKSKRFDKQPKKQKRGAVREEPEKSNRTVSEMLEELICRSVNTAQTSVQHNTSTNTLLPDRIFRVNTTDPKISISIPGTAVGTQQTSNNVDQQCIKHGYQADFIMNSTANQIFAARSQESPCHSERSQQSQADVIVIPTSIDSVIDSVVNGIIEERPSNNSTPQLISNSHSSTSRTTIRSLPQSESAQNEVLVLDDDEEEGGDGEDEEETPFCKNCTSEVPLILKRLNRLDGIMDKMMTLVKDEITSRQQSNLTTVNNQNQGIISRVEVINGTEESISKQGRQETTSTTSNSL